ncbi:unnamed protein product (macronuclear) [Paramecium tetraurelia]|uniref:Uncharacterized protein n=1 Tax=Paramecium tetraurelia TaxID=5888 RepID=A0EHA0_PARTE|nr:uncharacterized protein GSPATT00027015001 [Paramecium tetraurelia]CAK94691.1 unnamed protein product [Paramecium tetraurelia]|eukprot:XP_001462064.1 hypothetical protein (macronuclear) [Paramecium tetraurelia strain d4-2]
MLEQKDGQFQCKEMSFQYELLPHINIQQQTCWAVSINSDDQLLLIGAESNINIMQFKAGAVKKIQTIQKHQSWITTLNFFKQISLFISGSSSVKIWSSNLLSNPKFLLKLQEHSSNIQCLALRNSTPSVIISGSKDCNIKFWYQKENQWICLQTIREHSNIVSGLSLNQEGNSLISCGDDNQILIIKCTDEQRWNVVQKIQGHGVRLSFISQESFAFQPWQSDKLELYTYEPQIGQYQKNKEIAIKGSKQFCTHLFPCSFIPSKHILLSKNAYNLNLIRLNTSSSILHGKLEQAIEFNYPNNWLGTIFGTMSENGDFLITWDSQSKQIQIRKYKEIYKQRRTQDSKMCTIF